MDTTQLAELSWVEFIVTLQMHENLSNLIWKDIVLARKSATILLGFCKIALRRVSIPILTNVMAWYNLILIKYDPLPDFFTFSERSEVLLRSENVKQNNNKRYRFDSD